VGGVDAGPGLRQDGGQLVHQLLPHGVQHRLARLSTPLATSWSMGLYSGNKGERHWKHGGVWGYTVAIKGRDVGNKLLKY